MSLPAPPRKKLKIFCIDYRRLILGQCDQAKRFIKWLRNIMALIYVPRHIAIIAAVLVGCFPVFATTTVTGNIKNLGTGAVSQGSFVRFYLRGCAGNLPRIAGTAIIAPTLGNVYYFDMVPNSSGAISGTLYSTRDATGNGNGEIECGGSFTAVWFGMVPFLNGKAGPEVPFHTKLSATVDVSNVTPITTNPVVTAGTGDGTYMRLDAGNSPATGAWAFNSSVTAQKVNGNLWVGSGAGQYSSIAACYAALAVGQKCRVTAGWSDPTWSANLVLTLNNTCIVLEGSATVPMSTFQITKASGVNNVCIEGAIPIGKYPPASAAARFTYTGTATPFSLGDSAGDSNGLSLKRLDIDITGAGSAAHCIDLFRTQVFQIDNVTCSGLGGNNTQIGMVLDGTNNFTGDSTITLFRATLVQKGVQLNNGANANKFIMPNFSLSATGNIGIDIENGNGNSFDTADIEGAATAVNVASNAGNFGNRGSVYNQGNTTDIAFGALAFANAFDFIGGVTGPVVTDSSPIGANKATWMGNNGLLNYQGAQGTLTGNASDQNMFTTYTLKANTVLPGRGLKITCVWAHATGAGPASVTYKILIDSTSVGTAVSTGVDNTATESVISDVMNAAGSQSSQTLLINKKLRDTSVANVIINNSTITQGTAAINFAVQHTINCSFNVANTDTVTPEQLKIELVN